MWWMVLAGCYSVTCGPGTELVDDECVIAGETGGGDADADADTDSDTDADTDTADPLGPPVIGDLELTCTADELHLVAAVGSADAADLYYMNTASGPGSGGDETQPPVSLGLIDQDVFALDCDGLPMLTFVLRTYTADQVGGTLADCVAWGDDPAGLVDGSALADLCASCAGPTRPEELAGCRILTPAG